MDGPYEIWHFESQCDQSEQVNIKADRISSDIEMVESMLQIILENS